MAVMGDWGSVLVKANRRHMIENTPLFDVTKPFLAIQGNLRAKKAHHLP
jgi:hypothetical protein